jgi:hypothetical protein
MLFLIDADGHGCLAAQVKSTRPSAVCPFPLQYTQRYAPHRTQTHPRSNCALGLTNQSPLRLQVSNQDSLKAAVDAAAAFLNKAVKPVLVAGGHLRSEKAMGAFAGLVLDTPTC